MGSLTEIPPNFGEWVKNTRLEDFKWTFQELADRCDITRRTLVNIESGQFEKHTDSSLKDLGSAFNMTFDQLIDVIDELWEKHRASIPKLDNFEQVLASFTKIDDNIRHLLRSVDDEMRKAEPEIIQTSYNGLLSFQVSQRFPYFDNPLSDFSTFLTNPEIIQNLIDSLPRPDLIIDVDEEFTRIKYTVDQGTMVLDDAELLWDCCCTPSKESPSPKCRIHNKELGSRVTDCMRENVKIIYRDFDFYWKDVNALWPPSIDSFYMIDNIINNTDIVVSPNRKISSIIDIGAGTGFLGIILSHLIDDVKHLCLTDWTTTSYLYSSINWLINMERHRTTLKPTLEFRVAANTDWDFLRSNKRKKDLFDLVICNPPYLPIPDKFRKLRIENTTAGTELLEHVITRSQNLGKTVIIQFSHLAQERAECAADEAGVQLKPIGEPKLVPFRIPSALKNRDYVQWLTDEEAEGKENRWALILNKDKRSKKKRHKYYHYIQTYFVES